MLTFLYKKFLLQEHSKLDHVMRLYIEQTLTQEVPKESNSLRERDFIGFQISIQK